MEHYENMGKPYPRADISKVRGGPWAGHWAAAIGGPQRFDTVGLFRDWGSAVAWASDAVTMARTDPARRRVSPEAARIGRALDTIKAVTNGLVTGGL